MPKSVQGKAKQLIWRRPAKRLWQLMSSYQINPKACECLQKDKEILFTFYDFPAQHWSHLRTTNPIESTFATVRLRTHRTKGSGSRIATLTMVFKLGMEAQKHWRRLNGPVKRDRKWGAIVRWRRWDRSYSVLVSRSVGFLPYLRMNIAAHFPIARGPILAASSLFGSLFEPMDQFVFA
jgi:hypothetical protein